MLRTLIAIVSEYLSNRPRPGTTSFASELQANTTRCIHRVQKKNSRAVGYLVHKADIFIVNNSCVFISSETDHPGVPIVKNYKTVCCKTQTDIGIRLCYTSLYRHLACKTIHKINMKNWPRPTSVKFLQEVLYPHRYPDRHKNLHSASQMWYPSKIS